MPTNVATSTGGWSYKATVPGDSDLAAAVTAFQHYTSVAYTMETKVQHTNDLVKYSDGNVLTLANNYVDAERKSAFAMVGTQTVRVTSAVKNTANPPVVTINECTDSTKLVAISTYGPNKGKQAAPPPAHPYPATYRVHKGADGTWRVNAVTAEPNTSC